MKIKAKHRTSLQPFALKNKKGKYTIMLLCENSNSGMIHKYVVILNVSKENNLGG